MAELNLKQITEKLNAEFAGETRKLIFWYDENGDFADDVDTMDLQNAKVYHLTPTNQFKTKVFLERTDTTTSYLLYAPFAKPPVAQNHLEDMLLYSKRFDADRASLICVDLGLPEELKPKLQHYIAFFGKKDRAQRFYNYQIETYTADVLETALMAAVCKCKTASFDEVLCAVLQENLEENRLLAEMEKYNLAAAFWKQCDNNYGYQDAAPTLEKLVISMFITGAVHTIKAEAPKAWQASLCYKSGNVIAFLDGLMNNVLYGKRYDELSAMVQASLQAEQALKTVAPDALLECDSFACVDAVLIGWVNARLLAEDTAATLEGSTIPEICQRRSKSHFGSKRATQYELLQSAWQMICKAHYKPQSQFKDLVEQYLTEDYKLDQWYRRFYTCFDQLDEPAGFEPLKSLVENIYGNEYLAKLIPAWNRGIVENESSLALSWQINFYNNNVDGKERTVVIISDAMRYEVGQSLMQKLLEDPKCTADLKAMQSVLPSYTRLGMAALLPRKNLTMTEDYRVLMDGQPCDTLATRQAVLQGRNEQGSCIQFDDLKACKREELRSVFTGRQVVYVYHNQIDARGDKPNTEDEVFNACEEAVAEIANIIQRIATSANTYRFVITADHGFLYKREPLAESDKIENTAAKTAWVNRRFIVNTQPVQQEGVASLPMSRVLNSESNLYVSFPVGANVFKVAGGGQNYVHGGSSPQEMIVPLLTVKMERGHMETRPAQINLVSILKKVTQLILMLDFQQVEPVSDVVKAATYRVYFVSDDNERISNENIIVADSRSAETAARMFHQKFTFKNKKYDTTRQYFLVAYDDKNDVEVLRHAVKMDIAMADDFGF